MNNLIKSFIKEEDGMGTVEIVVIIAVLVGVALIFRTAIIEFVRNLMNSIFSNDEIVNTVKDGGTWK